MNSSRFSRAQAPVWALIYPFILTCLFSLLTLPTQAGDWPQINGPTRDGHAAKDEKAVDPTKAPSLSWKHPVGEGFAGPVVSGDACYVFHRKDRQEVLQILDRKTGAIRHETAFASTYRGGVNSDRGPRCVPIVQSKQVFLFGASGELHAVDATTGKAQWSRNAYGDYKGQEGYFGAGATPIVVGDLVLVNVGGRGGAGVVAFDTATGKTRWKTGDERASYSSPVRFSMPSQAAKSATSAGDQVIFITRMNCLALNATDGSPLFRIPFGKSGATVNAAMPLVVGDRLFLSSSYGVGARWIDLKATKTADASLWSNDETLSSQYASAVHIDGRLYGTHGREDIGVADFRCVDAASAKILQEETGFGMSHIIVLEKKQLLILQLDGTLKIAEVTPTGFTMQASHSLANGLTRSMPAYANRQVLLRNNEGDDSELFCWEF